MSIKYEVDIESCLRALAQAPQGRGGLVGRVSSTRPEGSEFESRFHGRTVVCAGWCTLNLVVGQMYSRWCGVDVLRGGCQLRCRPRHLTGVQNDDVRPKIAIVLLQNGTLI